MFNKNKEDLKEMKKMLEKLNNDIYPYCTTYGYVVSHGLKSQVQHLVKENDKLKAIIAELCDYVYKEDK